MLSFKEVNILAQILNDTFGVGSTGTNATSAIKASLEDDILSFRSCWHDSSKFIKEDDDPFLIPRLPLFCFLVRTSKSNTGCSPLLRL